MKAIVYHRHGPPEVLQLEEIPNPVPLDDQVLIRVLAAGLNPLDWRLMRAPLWFTTIVRAFAHEKVSRPGVDVAGIVEATGTRVTRFKAGDAVFGTCKGSCAEYACTSESELALKPANITFDQAAAVPVAAFTALQGLRDHGGVRPGQKVLIVGAAGGVGTFAVQIARWLGAQVTAVCSTRNLDLVRSLGASHVVDYTQEDFTRSTERYDVILDLIANRSVRACVRLLTPKGIYVAAGAPKGMFRLLLGLLMMRVLPWFVSQRTTFFMAKRRVEDLKLIGELMESGHVVPVIDQAWPLNETAEAIRYLEQGHARGKVVIHV
ncbi:MAG TPA: NAD(P)-dependent alcohol dehydrogenase [Acidobacteriaceae bacterium]|nr:NAD(P)-dependent alcohol dehydrogenase [Acidobacteriaceae bacterium]